jgi:hypothetical protein
MNDSTAVADLWQRIEPAVLRQMAEAFAAIGRGVRVESVPYREEDEK